MQRSRESGSREDKGIRTDAAGGVALELRAPRDVGERALGDGVADLDSSHCVRVRCVGSPTVTGGAAGCWGACKEAGML